MTERDMAILDAIVRDAGRGPEAVIPILQAVQAHYHYLPPEALERVCDITDITPAAIAGVATFYDHFRHKPAGEHCVRVCHGTACHVRGAELVQQAIEHHLGLASGEDTDADRRYTVEKIACLGSCTLAPVMQIDEQTSGYVAPERIAMRFAEFEASPRPRERERQSTELTPAVESRGEIRVGLGSCCVAKGSEDVYHTVRRVAGEYGVPVNVQRVGCVGMCHRTPLVEVVMPGDDRKLYVEVQPNDARSIVDRHFAPRRSVRRMAAQWLDVLRGANNTIHDPLDDHDPTVTAFLGPQRHIATEHFGVLDPLSLEAYVARGGFGMVKRCMGNDPGVTVETIAASRLRGRGGAGFNVGVKWDAVRLQNEQTKYVICNGDEGDPGAFMDRMLLESFPYRIIEGMLIAGHAVGASEGIFYIRAEYPLAIKRVEHAIRECERAGLIGDDATMRLTIRQGAGAFICGEETALIESLEGKRGHPRIKPPYPAEVGYRGKPTLVNNVETFACVPWIMRYGAGAFAAIGTANSTGTKVFALAGKVRRGGLIEVPMGVTVRQVVEQIGGGIADGRKFKAVQIGGPSGGCVPASLADTPIDYEALRDVGAIMGSGGLVVLDDSDCMVDLARYFLRFTQQQSCGQCTFCRIGTRRMLDILDRICEGRGRRGDLNQLDELARVVQKGSLCGLGATAPNPVLTTLRYFRDEYEAHLAGRCPAGKCKNLIHYVVNDNCVGCTICAQHCPADAIAMRPYERHEIDDKACTRCDSCRVLCPHDAIEVN
jgi:NADH-quinone oxidoreductase subunit F